VKPYLEILRPVEWTKNLLVAVPLLVAPPGTLPGAIPTIVLAVVCFCAVASAVYIFNDFCDRSDDARHKRRRSRPLASGRLPVGRALTLAAVLAAAGLGGYLYLGVPAFGAVLAYCVLNVLYSMGLKGIAVLELFIVASGFPLRIIVGSLLVGSFASYWALFCVAMGALFVVTAKRRTELVRHGSDSRPVLREYNADSLGIMLATALGAALVFYSLFTLSDYAESRYGTWVPVTVLPVALAGFRYLALSLSDPEGRSPTVVLLRDPITLLCGLIVLATYGYLINAGG